MKPVVPMSSPDIDESDVAAAAEVVRSGRLALGPHAEAFERAVAARVGVPHAVALSSGTAALHILVRALGIGPGDEVLVPSFTFAASANAVLYEGATPVFVDIQADTCNLDPASLEARVTRRTKAIMAVDVFGHPADWDEILAVAERHRLRVIDDSCEALGATYRGRPLGQLGDAAAFAFYPNKQITTGEGGMIATADEDIARQARSLRNQGRAEMGAWLEHERLGYNYRMDEMSAALGCSQLRRLDAFLGKRERVAKAYGARLRSVEGVRPLAARPYVRHSWFVYVVMLSGPRERDAVMAAMAARGVPTRAYFVPLHQQPYLRERLGAKHDLPRTEEVARRTLALPFHNNLRDADVETVVRALDAACDDSM